MYNKSNFLNSKNKKKHLRHNKIMKKKIILISITCLIITFLIGLITFTFSSNIYINHPNYLEFKNTDGEVDYAYTHQYQGGYVKIEEVSQEFLITLITTEDKNFYNHHGFDYKRIIKSMIDNFLSNSITQGASTITQQLAKNLYLSNEKTWSRKIQEALIAKKIENRYSKEYILELYINSVYFAHNLYGLKIASEFYFHKEPSELNFQESCILVGVINAPNAYSPFIDEKASNEKKKNIAYNLFKNSKITAEEYYKIIYNKPKLYGYLDVTQDIERYYHQAIFRELKYRNLYNELDTEQGLSIETYYKKEIEEIIKKSINRYEFEDQVSVVVMKPYSNEVLALCGGKNYLDSQYNRALDSYRQIGSTIKPFIYYLGLTQGMTPLSKFTSKPTTFTLEDGTLYTPNNANNIYANRKINMVEALGMSDNIYAVKTTLLVGSKNVARLLNALGGNITSPTLAISLGGVEMTPLELTAAYNALASEGKYYPPHFIKKVSLFNDTILYSDKRNYSTVLKYDETLMINHLLKSSFDKGLITYSTPTMASYQVNSAFACKTGTTSSSSWTVGFNKDYTVLVYVGSDDNQNLKDGKVSKKIFRDIVTSLTLNKEENFYSFPSYLKSFKLHNGIYNTYSFNYLTRKN